VAILPQLLLALALTFFLAYQARSLTLILKSHRAHAAAQGRPRGVAAVVWMGLPILVVIALVVRSWIAVVDADRPAVASSAAQVTPAPTGRSIPSAP
jgi:hypothetical protein